jgi:alkanesulfonate monooxygenase SsuD/methylene tetrahydromethanopterin reductase-like flavin-dependent oxidoreductase (luciferase family)
MLPADFHTACLTFSSVLRAGEKPTAERVIDEVGSMVAASLHFWWEIAQKAGHDGFIPAFAREEWEQYKKHVASMRTPPEKRYQEIHEGHCTYLVPEERRFVTANTIRAAGGLVGEPDELVARLRELERAGLREVTLLPPLAQARKCLRDFSEQVMARLR